METPITTFILGTSTVVTLPKTFSVKPGVKYFAKKAGENILLKKDASKKETNGDIIRKLAGGSKGKFDFTPAQLKRNYELGTYGKTWK